MKDHINTQAAHAIRAGVAMKQSLIAVSAASIDVTQRWCDAVAELFPGPYTNEWDDAVTQCLMLPRLALMGAEKNLKKYGFS